MDAVNGTQSRVDLSLFPLQNVDQMQMESKEFNELRKACEELGFFAVINHGIDQTLVKEVDAKMRDMFALPAEVKKRAIFPIFNSGYGTFEVHEATKESTPESVSFPWDHLLPNSIEKISEKLWPEGNPEFCKDLNEYRTQLRELSHRILKLLVWSLGVDVSSKSASELFEKSHGNIRVNYYEKSTEKEMVSNLHTDISCITLLYQDEIGGLQIRTKEGTWIDDKPLPGSFVVNIGDIFQMWSNGRYRSAEHRVVYGKSNTRRLSMAYFHDFLDEFLVRCPEEMIDEEHPQMFKIATKGDIVAYYKKVGGANITTTQHFKLHY